METYVNHDIPKDLLTNDLSLGLIKEAFYQMLFITVLIKQKYHMIFLQKAVGVAKEWIRLIL